MSPKKNIKHSSTEIFSIAARELISNLGRGEQKRAAKAIEVSPAYLNDLLAGRKNWSDRLRDKLAAFLKMSVAEIYLVGERFLESGFLFPYVTQVDDTAKYSVERAMIIINLALKEYHLMFEWAVSPNLIDALRDKNPSIDRYLNSEISDGEFLYEMREMVRAVISHYLK